MGIRRACLVPRYLPLHAKRVGGTAVEHGRDASGLAWRRSDGRRAQGAGAAGARKVTMNAT